MKWTTDKPTADGLYLYKNQGSINDCGVACIIAHGILRAHDHIGEYTAEVAYLSNMEWLGPIIIEKSNET